MTSQEQNPPNVVQVPNGMISGGPGNCSPWCWLNNHRICHEAWCHCLCHDPRRLVIT